MQICKSIRKLLCSMDFFPTSQFLCYKGESSYSTATGGCLSICIIIIFFVLFTSTGLQVINKQNVNSSSLLEQTIDPGFIQLQAGPEGGFMFMLYVLGVNITNPAIRMFDVYILQQEFAPVGILVNNIRIEMEPCTQQHFSFNGDILKQFQAIGGPNFLCPPLNHKFQLQGRLASEVYKVFKVQIAKCNSTLYSNCANDSYFKASQTQMGGTFLTALGSVNTLINPSSTKNYKHYYFQDRNLFRFSPTLNVQAKSSVSEYQITTDQSLSPFTQNKYQSGVYTPQLAQYQVTGDSQTVYFQALFAKSTSKISFTRSFQKIDQFFSYVGGLIGTVLGLIIIMSMYNQVCYYISVANKLFTYNQTQRIDSDQFNFVYFILYLFYKLARCFNCLENCRPMKLYHDTQEELKLQLDVVFLMRRIISLQKAISLLLSDHQITALYTQNKLTLEEAEKQRKKHHLVYRLKKKATDYQENSFELKQTQQQMKEVTNQDQSMQNKKKNIREGEWSQTSFNSFKSSSFQSLKQKMHRLENETKEGNNASSKLMGHIDPRYITMLFQKQEQKGQSRRDKYLAQEDLAAEKHFHIYQQQQLSKNQMATRKFNKHVKKSQP